MSYELSELSAFRRNAEIPIGKAKATKGGKKKKKKLPIKTVHQYLFIKNTQFQSFATEPKTRISKQISRGRVRPEMQLF